MTIRCIAMSDVAQVYHQCVKYHREMGYGLSLAYGSVENIVRRAALLDGMVVLVADDNGIIVGVIGFSIGVSYLNGIDPVASEFIWHSDPDLTTTTRGRVMVSLLLDAEKCLDAMGIERKTIHIPDGSPVRGFLERHGYGAREIAMVKGG